MSFFGRDLRAQAQLRAVAFTAAALLAVALASPSDAADWTLIGWNEVGMHCIDPDYAVFALMPPYNTLLAQLIDPSGMLVRDAAGITVTYEAVADPDGSIDTTSIGKTNFWEHVDSLFGVSLALDAGLSGFAMPGSANQPQPMAFDATAGWFGAEGIPITPYDDAGAKNMVPLMRLTARDTTGAVLATTDVVLPVSDELGCTACHASGSTPGAQPPTGWVNDPDPVRDVRLNILRLHDQREFRNQAFNDALSTAGYDPNGLYATAVDGGRAVLCARCHFSAALPGSGIEGIEPLTTAVHRRMAGVLDPVSGGFLDAADNRSACYRCHPGTAARSLRGAMGAAVASDGTRAIECQSCHGRMLDVASPDRTGWLDEPACQSCHTGTAVHNNGEIRYLSTREEDGAPRAAVDDTFATDQSLFRLSTGHGGLSCAACHGSAHAELPSAERNDNLQSIAIDGHPGVLSECTACHASPPSTVDGGPHGLHPIGQTWVEMHPKVAEDGGAAACRACHGADYRGTVLSRAQADRTLQTDFGTKRFWRGFQIGCYACHDGPGGGEANPNRAAVVQDVNASTVSGLAVAIALTATDADGDPLALRIVSQAAHGAVGLDGTTARYVPDPDFNGSDSFTFAAWDGAIDSNLGQVSVSVSAPARPCDGDCRRDGQVSIDELITSVQIALGRMDMDRCPEADADRNGTVGIDDLVGAVNAALNGCPRAATAAVRLPD